MNETNDFTFIDAMLTLGISRNELEKAYAVVKQQLAEEGGDDEQN